MKTVVKPLVHRFVGAGAVAVVAASALLGGGLAQASEPGAEVLVAFEHGDIRQPIVVGSLWNGADAPPESETKDDEPRVREATPLKLTKAE